MAMPASAPAGRLLKGRAPGLSHTPVQAARRRTAPQPLWSAWSDRGDARVSHRRHHESRSPGAPGGALAPGCFRPHINFQHGSSPDAAVGEKTIGRRRTEIGMRLSDPLPPGTLPRHPCPAGRTVRGTIATADGRSAVILERTEKPIGSPMPT